MALASVAWSLQTFVRTKPWFGSNSGLREETPASRAWWTVAHRGMGWDCGRLMRQRKLVTRRLVFDGSSESGGTSRPVTVSSISNGRRWWRHTSGDVESDWSQIRSSSAQKAPSNQLTSHPFNQSSSRRAGLWSTSRKQQPQKLQRWISQCLISGNGPVDVLLRTALMLSNS